MYGGEWVQAQQVVTSRMCISADQCDAQCRVVSGFRLLRPTCAPLHANECKWKPQWSGGPAGAPLWVARPAPPQVAAGVASTRSCRLEQEHTHTQTASLLPLYAPACTLRMTATGQGLPAMMPVRRLDKSYRLKLHSRAGMERLMGGRFATGPCEVAATMCRPGRVQRLQLQMGTMVGRPIQLRQGEQEYRAAAAIQALSHSRECQGQPASVQASDAEHSTAQHALWVLQCSHKHGWHAVQTGAALLLHRRQRGSRVKTLCGWEETRHCSHKPLRLTPLDSDPVGLTSQS